MCKVSNIYHVQYIMYINIYNINYLHYIQHYPGTIYLTVMYIMYKNNHVHYI